MQIIDIHAHDGAWDIKSPPGKYDLLGGTMPEFIADLDRDNVSHCFLSSVTALIRDMVTGNSETYADAALDPRLFAYTYYDPTRVEESIAEIEKYRTHPKFIGFKTRPEYHKMGLDDARYQPLLEAAAQLGKPILAHSFPRRDAGAMAAAARAFPAARLIMVHACGEHWREAVPVIRSCPNIWVEPVTSSYYPGKVRFILEQVGHERLIFGSDYGLISRPRVRRYYDEAGLSAADEEAMYRTNAIRLFGL
jgi:uncharacterized protein